MLNPDMFPAVKRCAYGALVQRRQQEPVHLQPVCLQGGGGGGHSLTGPS